jgi:signal transduction histidine kinase
MTPSNVAQRRRRRVPLPILVALLTSAAILIVNAYIDGGDGGSITSYLAAAVILSQLVFCYYLIQLYVRRRVESEDKLNALNAHVDETVEARSAEAVNLSRHLLTAREEEKARIARELHDELGSSLTAVTMDLTWVRQHIEDPAVTARLARAMEVLRTTIDMKRRIIQDLRPSLLDNLGLNAAIESHAAEFTQRTGVQVSTDVPDDLPPLKEDCPIALFRIFQEALTNVARHAQATKIHVSLRVEGGTLVLEISDDGIGFTGDIVRAGASYGLMGMRERAQLVGGQFTITGGANARGCIVRAELPCLAESGAP